MNKKLAAITISAGLGLGGFTGVLLGSPSIVSAAERDRAAFGEGFDAATSNLDDLAEDLAWAGDVRRSAGRPPRWPRVAEQNGATEIILLYMEAADTDFPTRPLPMADEDGDVLLNEAEARSLFTRMKSVITPVSG